MRAKRADGWGRSSDADAAWRISVIETLERIANIGEGARTDLGTSESVPHALDYRVLPRHSEREIALNPATVSNVGPDSEMRWVDGVDLATGGLTRVPAIMVYLQGPAYPAERFWTPISTGVAAGPTRESALFSAICEAIERDIVSVLWLQRLPLPRVHQEEITSFAQRLIAWCEHKYMRAHLFDATSEIGVPTAYCLIETPHDTLIGRAVGASAEADMASAIEKALCEAISLQSSLGAMVAESDSKSISLIAQGAVEVARPDRFDAFDFLLNHTENHATPPTFGPGILPLDGPNRLENLIQRCELTGHKIYAVDLTTPDLKDLDLHVARVVIPSLQPLGFDPNARFLGHPRLYKLPALLGYRVLSETALNQLPQPFG